MGLGRPHCGEASAEQINQAVAQQSGALLNEALGHMESCQGAVWSHLKPSAQNILHYENGSIQISDEALTNYGNGTLWPNDTSTLPKKKHEK